MIPPTKEQARKEMDDALKVMDLNSPDWKMLREWLGWRKYILTMGSMSQVDGAKRAELHGMARLCDELLNLKPLQNQQT